MSKLIFAASLTVALTSAALTGTALAATTGSAVKRPASSLSPTGAATPTAAAKIGGATDDAAATKPSTAAATANAAATPPTTAAAAATAPAKAPKYKERKQIDFSNQTIEGKVRRPEAALITAGEATGDNGLLRLREDFMDRFAAFAGEEIQ